MEFRTLWQPTRQPLFKPKFLPRISNSLAQHLLVLSRNSALTVFAVRHVAARAFYEAEISNVVSDCESMLGMSDASTKLQVAKKEALDADLVEPHFALLRGIFFEWLYDRLPVLLLLNRPDGRIPNDFEIEYISRDCFRAGHNSFTAFASNKLRFPGSYGKMMNLAKQRCPDKKKLSDAIYDSTWLISVFQKHFPDLCSGSNKAIFVAEVLGGCFPMFYNDLLHYYRQLTIDASNFGWCHGQSVGAEMFAAEVTQISNSVDMKSE